MKYLSIITFTFFSFLVSAQSFEARYSMTEIYDFSNLASSNRNGNMPRKSKPEPISLQYKGYLYHSGDSTISFLKPLYLNEFPDGDIEIKTPAQSANTKVLYSTSTDTIQNVKLIVCNDTVSTAWSWLNSGGRGRDPEFRHQGGIYTSQNSGITWKSNNEKKEINGLECEKMQGFYGLGKVPKFECWIYKGLISSIGINNEYAVPGLILEGSGSNGSRTVRYKLDYLKIGQPLPKGIFWPAAFNQLKFIDYRDPANRKKAADEIKEALKNVDIMAQ